MTQASRDTPEVHALLLWGPPGAYLHRSSSHAGSHSGSKDTHLKPKVTSLSPWTVMALHVVHKSGVLHTPTHRPQTLLITAYTFKKGTLFRRENHVCMH